MKDPYTNKLLTKRCESIDKEIRQLRKELDAEDRKDLKKLKEMFNERMKVSRLPAPSEPAIEGLEELQRHLEQGLFRDWSSLSLAIAFEVRYCDVRKIRQKLNQRK